MDKKIIIAIVLILAIGFIVGKEFTEKSVKQELQTKEFTIDATRFEYNPSNITVRLGDRIRIKVNNIDSGHGIRIPEFNISGTNEIEFIADKAGEFKWYCNIFCGSGHRGMNGTLIVK